MKSSIFTLLLVLGLAFGKDLCKEELRMSVDVEDADLQKNGTLLTESDSYPAGTFWKDEEEGHWWVCPCLLGNCIRICEGEFIEEIIESDRGTKPILPFLWDEIIETDTPPIESFKQILNAKCDGYHDILNKEDVRILGNGKMRLENESKLYDAEDYCVHQMERINSIHLVHCLSNQEEEFEETISSTKMVILIIVFVTYCVGQDIFILCIDLRVLNFTVGMYKANQQIKSFHGRSVLCYLACLAMNRTVMTVNAICYYLLYFIFEISIGKELCILIGLIDIYSHLASIFWLNAMCLDIFFTYRGVSRTGKYYFAKFAIYSFGGPLVIVTVALFSQLINDENSIWSPNLGNGICMINGNAPVWFYYRGPSLFFLLVNIGLVSATYCMSYESFEVVHNITEETNHTASQEKERRRMYLMLTLMVCFMFIAKAILILFNSIDDLNDLIFLNLMTVCLSRMHIIYVYICVNPKPVTKNSPGHSQFSTLVAHDTVAANPPPPPGVRKTKNSYFPEKHNA